MLQYDKADEYPLATEATRALTSQDLDPQLALAVSIAYLRIFLILVNKPRETCFPQLQPSELVRPLGPLALIVASIPKESLMS